MGRAEDIYEKVVSEGETAIDEFVLTSKSEELFLDFKRSASGGEGRVLDNRDRRNLARAISGFGNSEGGVVIWGIKCSPDDSLGDVAQAKRPITNARRFASWLEGAVSGCTVPPHTGVQNHAIVTAQGRDGFVGTYIPMSVYAPHQVVGELRYYIRAGSSFVPTPHAVLAGMFGARPQPRVGHVFLVSPADLVAEAMKVEIGFLVRNRGRGVARDVFIQGTVSSAPGDNCELSFEPAQSELWRAYWGFGAKIGMICTPDFRLPPQAETQPFTMTVNLVPPFTGDLRIDVVSGSAQSPLCTIGIKSHRDCIQRVYNEFLPRARKGTLTTEERKDAARRIFWPPK